MLRKYAWHTAGAQLYLGIDVVTIFPKAGNMPTSLSTGQYCLDPQRGSGQTR